MASSYGFKNKLKIKPLYTIFLVLLIFLLTCGDIFSQYSQKWTNLYPGVYLNQYPPSVMDSKKNVYVLGMYYNSSENYDCLILKYDSSGNLKWSAIYGNPSFKHDEVYAIALDNEGNVYATGRGILGDSYDMLTIKFDSSGQFKWVKWYGNSGEPDASWDIALDKNNNIYICGTEAFQRRSIIIKYDSFGNQMWVRVVYGINWPTAATNISLDSAANIYVSGFLFSSRYRTFVAKHDNSGNQMWWNYYTGTYHLTEQKMVIDKKGNMYITNHEFGGAIQEVKTLKYNDSGDLQWVKTYDDAGPNVSEYASSIAIDKSENIYISGHTGGDMFILSYNSMGNQRWVDKYGQGNSFDDVSNSLVLDSNDNIYAHGYTIGEKYLTIKYDSFGVRKWVNTYKATGSEFQRGSSISVSPDGSIVSVTGTERYGSSSFYRTLQFSSVVITDMSLSPRNSINPFNTQHCITANVLDQNAAPVKNVTVQFTRIGANPGSGSAVTDSVGNAVYCYIGTNPGRDTISGLVENLTDTVYVFWDEALPVELISFTSNVERRSVTLNWNTIHEINNYGFEIERSNKVRDWSLIGFVQGNGTTYESKNYFFTDKDLNTGKYFYRLKQIDFNGNFELYNLNNEIEIGTPNLFSISQNYPNPFNPNTKIDFDLPNDGYVKLTIYDLTGREVSSLVNDLNLAGYYTIDFNASNLSSGIYLYKIDYNAVGINETKIMKMIVLK